MLYNCNDLTFNILSVHVLKWDDSHHFVAPRPFSALTFRISGSTHIITATQSISSHPGDITFVPAGVSYEAIDSKGEIITINFKHNNYESDVEIFTFDTIKFNRLFLDILSAWNEKKNMYEINILMYTILSELRKYSEQAIDSNDPFYKALEYINTNFRISDLKIADVCKLCGLSESSFRMKMNREYNMSPSKYITHLRATYACRLLSENLLTIEEIALESGFSDSKYFSRVIKKLYGAPPSKLFF